MSKTFVLTYFFGHNPRTTRHMEILIKYLDSLTDFTYLKIDIFFVTKSKTILPFF